MTEQTETTASQADSTGATSPTVALIDARLAELDGGPSSIGLQQGRIATLASELTTAETNLAACLAEKADLQRDRALLAPEPPTEPTDPEETA